MKRPESSRPATARIVARVERISMTSPAATPRRSRSREWRNAGLCRGRLAGTTIDGLLELEEGGLRVTLIKSVVRATSRAICSACHFERL